MQMFLIVTIIFISSARAGLLFTYNQLTTKDLEQMNQLVRNKIKESKTAGSGQVVPLKEALQAVYSRPNQDNVIEKVMPALKAALDHDDESERVYKELIDEALNALTHTKNFKKEVQVTYSIFLENIISEFKPDLKKDSFEEKMIRKIAEKNIQLTKDAINDRRLRLMSESPSPSQIASKIIQDWEVKATIPESEPIEKNRADKNTEESNTQDSQQGNEKK